MKPRQTPPPCPPAHRAPLSLAALVVSHDRLDQLRQTLACLLAEPPDRLAAVVVVDNCSGDGTAEWLAGVDDPRLQVLRPARNLGGAGGFELGMRHVRSRIDPDWLVLMDDDARPDAGAIAGFHALDLRGWQAVAAAVREPDGRICDMNRPFLNPFAHARTFLRTLAGGGRGAFHLQDRDFDPATAGACQVDGASFVGFFISREGMELAGFPDGRLFIYGDDALYTLGLTRAGGRIMFSPQLRFEHAISSLRHGSPRMTPIWKVYYHHRNLMALYRAAAGPLFWPAFMLVLPKWVLKVRAYPGQRRVFLRLLARAVHDGCRRRFDMPHDRVLDLAGAAGPDGGAARQDRATPQAHVRRWP